MICEVEEASALCGAVQDRLCDSCLSFGGVRAAGDVREGLSKQSSIVGALLLRSCDRFSSRKPAMLHSALGHKRQHVKWMLKSNGIATCKWDNMSSGLQNRYCNLRIGVSITQGSSI